MADEQIVTNIVATSDFSSLIADVQRTTASLSKLQQQLSLSNKTLAAQAGQIQKAFGETLRSTGQFTTHFVTVGSEIDTFGKKLDGGKLKLGDYFRTWQQHTKTSGGLIRDLAKQQVALQNAVVQPLGKSADGLMKFNVHVANGLNETVSKTALARKELQIYNKVIQDGGVQLINWGKNTQWAGRQLTVGLTVPLAAFGMAAAKAFREADQELVRLTKVYGGLSAVSAQELAKVRKDVSATARELSAAYGSSFKDTIALAADIAATGKQGNELLESTKEATRLSVLGEVDRQEAMKATLAIQSAFKQNTTELTESINFLNAVENQTSTSLADLVEAIPKAGPVVKALGGDVEDLALYLTAMREGGINASEGANALKSALASIINPTKVAKEQFMGFGIDLEGIVNKNAGNLTQTILSIQSALDTLDPLKKSQAIEQLFGKFQFARMNALFENLGKQGSQTLQVLDLMKASSQDLANVAGRELSQITESASGQYKRAIESLKADLAGLGDQFLRIGTFFIKVVDGVVKFINKMPDPIKNLLGLLGGITALAGPLIMLTGVFANFIGYVIKGIGHLRSLGRGGEGFKLLTPEILAAEKAGSLIEKTFYNDAEAANVLKIALSNLTNELTILQQKAASGSISVQPTLSTIQGNIVAQGTQRVANPSSPYIGKPYTRQMLHQNPVAGMTTEEKAAQTIFGVTPGPGPVNQRIGKNPQIYMTDDMPRIKGLTEISGVSSGIVAQEAAKWHSMTAALAMQSKEEIALLKREVASTGTITTELSTSYQALLPQMTNITSLAAQEAKLIVAQLQSGKVTVDQARAKIISLNAQVEAMMAETAAAVATSQGRLLNITTVPLTGQPVVDPVTGKSNMKEMFHKSKTSMLVDKIARSLGVRTSGGGYSIETTRPKRFKDGDIVPGPNVNADVVPALLTPGEFVVRRDAVTPETLPILREINGPGTDSLTQNVGSSGAIRAQYSGRQLAHLTDSILSSNMSNVEKERIMTTFGLSMDQINDRRTKIGSSFFAGYDKFFNQGTNNGNLDIDKAIMYLEGKPVYDPKFAKGIVSHNPLIAYEAMMMDLGIPEESRGDFAKTIDEKIVAKLKLQRETGARFLADAPDASRGQVRASLVGDAIAEHIISLDDPKMQKSLKSLQSPGEARVYNPRRGTSDRYFPKRTNRASTLVASIIAKRKMPQVSAKVQGMFPNIRTKLAQVATQASEFLPRGKFVPRVKFNKGGMVGGMPVMGYKTGDLVRGLSGLRSKIRGTGTLGRSPQVDENGNPIVDMNSGMATSMAGMAMMMGGSQMPGMAGSAMTFAGLAMQMSPMLKMMKPLVSGMGTFAGILAKVRTVGMATFTALRIGLAALLGPVGLISAAIGGVIALFLKMKKDATDAGEVNRATYGLTGTALEEVGIKYKTVSERIKEVNQQLELNRAKVKSSYEAYTKSGVAGLDITLKALKEGIASAKKEDKESVGLFDKAKPFQVNQLAASMKAQYVALGMSVQEATNQIYILIKASNKSSQALDAISSESFKSISDKASGALYSVELLGKALSNKGLFNAEEFSRGLDNMLNSLTSYKNSLMETTKKQVGLTDLEANKEVIEKITKLGADKNKIEGRSLDSLKAQNLELASMLGRSETLASVYAKYQLYLSGASAEMNLSAMSAEDAVLALQGYNATKDAAEQVLGNTEIAKSARSAIKAAETAEKILDNAKKQDGSYIDAAIKNRQKLIKALEEERSARLKILDLQEKSANFETEIQQAQLRYQEALAAGDMAQAAQEQLNIQKLSGDRQRDLARQSINDKADAERKKLETEIEKLQAQKDAQAKALSIAQSSVAKKNEDAAAATAFLEEIKAAIANFGGDNVDDVNQFQALLNDKRSQGKGSQVQDLIDKFSGGYQSGSNMFEVMLKNLKSQTNKELEKSKYDKFDLAVQTFQEAVDKFAGIESISEKNPKTAGTEFGPTKTKTVEGKNVGEAGRNAVAGKTKSRSVEIPGKGNWTIFKYKGKEYAISADETTIYEYENGVGLKGKRLSPDFVPPKMATGGEVKHFEPGGEVSGPGTGTSDSIPAYLSNGEYVIKAAAVEQYGVDTFDAFNAQKLAIGGSVEGGGKKQNAYQKFMFGAAENSDWMDKLFGIDKIFRLLGGDRSSGNTLNAAMAALGGPSKGISKLADDIPQLFHGTSAALKPGSKIKPKSGFDSTDMLNSPYSFATKDSFLADRYAQRAALHGGAGKGWQQPAMFGINYRVTPLDIQEMMSTVSQYKGPDLAVGMGRNFLSKSGFKVDGVHSFPINPELVSKFADGGMAKKDGWLQKWARSLTGNPLSEMMGTAALLRKIAGVGQKGDNLSAAMMPLSFTGMGIGSKIGTSGGLMKALYSLPNKINQIKNQAKVNAMIKNGMWHGSQPQGHRGEDYLQGTNILDGAETHDPFYGMGFFGTTSKSEADLYASGYNSLNNWGQSSGSMNNIVGAPKGKYVDFTRGTNSLKWQNYELAKALGVKKNEYLGKYMTEKLGDVMNSQGMTGAIMNRVNAGRVPADIQDAKWLGWNNPAGVITKELGAASKGNGKSLGGIEKILSKLGDKSGSASAKMASIDKAALEKIGKNANQGWQEIQNARVAQLAKKYPDIDKLSVQKFNEIYAKEFYGLSPKDSLSIFKGDVIDAATAKATWDPSKASYFSRIPDVAAAYSDILRVAKSSQDKGGSILSSRLKISSLTNKLGEGIDPMSAQGMGEFPIKMTAENFQEIMQNLASHTPDEFAQLQGFASTGKKMGKYALDPMLGYAKAFGFANGGLLSIPRYSIGGMPQYNIPSDSMSVANKPFNRYNEGGLVNNYGGITVNGSPGMDEKMLAKYVMQEIKAADAINFASQGRPGSRYV
jgi:TP901 family phage tail tape measure protein